MKLLVRKIKDEADGCMSILEDPFFVENNYPQVIEELVETYAEYFGARRSFCF